MPRTRIFPAYAGVNRQQKTDVSQLTNLPRVCGGEPNELLSAIKEFGSSPRMRG